MRCFNQIKVCNIHWHPSFLSSGGLAPPEIEGSRLALWFPFRKVYHMPLDPAMTIFLAGTIVFLLLITATESMTTKGSIVKILVHPCVIKIKFGKTYFQRI